MPVDEAPVARVYTRDSFGNTTYSTGSFANPFQYTAREFDSETGLYYYRARYHDPTTARSSARGCRPVSLKAKADAERRHVTKLPKISCVPIHFVFVS